MTIFRLVAALVFLGIAGAILYDVRRGRGYWTGAWRLYRNQAKSDLIRWREKTSPSAGSIFEGLRRTASLVSIALFAILALTGFLPVVVMGNRLSGFLLIVHVTAAPLFALSLATLALLWAHRLRFEDDDLHLLLHPGRKTVHSGPRRRSLALKGGFWILLLLSLPLMGSIILSLFPLFGTEGGESLARIHGYSALLMLLAAVVVVYVTVSSIRNASEQPSKESAR
jgi:hypothetical protein